MFEEVLDCVQAHRVHVRRLLPVVVHRQDLARGHRQHLGIAASLVGHLQDADWAAGDHHSRRQRKRRDDEHIHRVAIVGKRARDVAVVARVMHRRGHEAVDEDCAAGLVDLVLDRVGVHRNFNDHIELIGRFGPRRHFVQAHEYGLGGRDNPNSTGARFRRADTERSSIKRGKHRGQRVICIA